MIDSLLVGATLTVFEDILQSKGVPYEVQKDAEYVIFKQFWDGADKEEKLLALRQARPAILKIVERELYIGIKDEAAPLRIRLNYLDRELAKDSFGEIMLERPALDWRISISIKNHANVLASMPLADRDTATFRDDVVNVFKEIDDFGERIFSVPCSNEYFDDMNDILQKITPLDRTTWSRLLTDKEFAYSSLFTPMLKAIGAELPRIMKDHPEAPKKLIEYFYGSVDYYFIKPIAEYKVTRIGAVNAHGDLGRIPGTHNYNTPYTDFPTKLLDVRFATGKHGVISRDTIQFTFDGGWAICLKISTGITEESGRLFLLNAFLPVTPFGSYRDQVEWDTEA